LNDSVSEAHPEPTIIPRAEHNLSRANVSKSALKVLYRLKTAGFAAYIVGGGVRDLLLGLNPKDFDIATDADPEEIKDVFRNARLIGRRFRLAHVRFGHEVIEANSGASALEILRHPRPIDLMITDYAMPKMTGAQLAAAARELRPRLPILLATGYAELPAGSALDLPRLGKPYQQAQLAAEIGKLLTAKGS